MKVLASFRRRRVRQMLSGLPTRARLTLRHHGLRVTVGRAVTFPLRFTRYRHHLGLASLPSDHSASARAWYARHGRRVAVVIPTHGDTRVVAAAIRSVRRTTDPDRVSVVVADDASPMEHRAELRRLASLEGFTLVQGDRQRGFAANCNRGIATVDPERDVVLLNSDVVAYPGWLEALQCAAYEFKAGITGPQLLYPNGAIQFGGMMRLPTDRDWFTHRHKGRHGQLAEAAVMQATLAVTGACMYITRATLDDVGVLDEAYPMGFEDVDYCLRAWNAGHRVLYVPAAVLDHHESRTRGLAQGSRELQSKTEFWARWRDWLDRREARASDGGVRVIYVTRDTAVAGGHRVIFSHLNYLKSRGHHPELWTLGQRPTWFDLDVPVRSFESGADLTHALAPVNAIKVATWWETADWVWEASVTHGIPVYWVQDLETSYYVNPIDRARVLATYRPEFHYCAGSKWVADQLSSLGVTATVITPGIDESFGVLPAVTRRDDVVLAFARTEPLKRFELTRTAYLALSEPRPELWLVGTDPELSAGLGERVRFIRRPSDDELNRLLNEAAIVVQTSKHEGFCLPILEAMQAGAAVVCTDAHGNREFCRDERNCLMPTARSRLVAGALERLLKDPALRDRLVAEGRRTAQTYAWPSRLDAMERHYRRLAEATAAGAGWPAPMGGG